MTTTPSMPALPEPAHLIANFDPWDDVPDTKCFSEAQMHAYARSHAAALAQRLAEAERDALRYRWLRDQTNHTNANTMVVNENIGVAWARVMNLDAAIDADMDDPPAVADALEP